jgi:hypothetical protein
MMTSRSLIHMSIRESKWRQITKKQFKILRVVLEKNESSNTSENVNYVSSAKVRKFKSSNLNSLFGLCEPDLILPFQLLEKIRNLSKPIIVNRNNTIYAASVAFIAG